MSQDTVHHAANNCRQKSNKTAKKHVQRMPTANERGQKAADKQSGNRRARYRGKHGKRLGESKLDCPLIQSKGVGKKGQSGVKRRDHSGISHKFCFFRELHGNKKAGEDPANLLSFVFREDRISNSRYFKKFFGKRGCRLRDSLSGIIESNQMRRGLLAGLLRSYFSRPLFTSLM